MMPSAITIRPVTQLADYYALEPLQRTIWDLPTGEEILPAHLLITFQDNGGLVLGAWHNDDLIGLCVGFLGSTPEGQIKFCSEIMGVLPAYRSQHVGYWLKCAQREHVLARGIRQITWTYDPLQTRNANLNLHKLGAVCRTFFPNLYGDIGGINAGLPTDRFQVDWWLDSPNVLARLAGAPTPTVAELLAQGVPVLHPLESAERPYTPQFLLQIPADFPTLKQTNLALAQAWRTHSSAHFQSAFAAGYSATDLLRDADACYYLIEKREP
jgi:predicted GNAT superfamily acetyltransferase